MLAFLPAQHYFSFSGSIQLFINYNLHYHYRVEEELISMSNRPTSLPPTFLQHLSDVCGLEGQRIELTTKIRGEPITNLNSRFIKSEGWI